MPADGSPSQPAKPGAVKKFFRYYENLSVPEEPAQCKAEGNKKNSSDVRGGGIDRSGGRYRSLMVAHQEFPLELS
jgi:hypothetical protein